MNIAIILCAACSAFGFFGSLVFLAQKGGAFWATLMLINFGVLTYDYYLYLQQE